MTFVTFTAADVHRFSPSSYLMINKAIVDHAKKQIKVFDALESSPDCKMNAKEIADFFGRDIKNINDYRSENTLLARIQRIVARVLSLLWILPSDFKVDQSLRDYKIRRAAFCYRTGVNEHRKIDKSEISGGLVRVLEERVLNFKKTHRYSEEQRKSLYGHDKKQIRKMAQYPALMYLFLEDPAKIETLFKFTIRSLYSVSCYMRFPAASEKLYRDRIAQQLNAWHGTKHIHRIDGNSIGIKFAAVNRQVDILRETHVKADMASDPIPIAEIFKDFAAQNDRHGEYSVLRTGIVKWAIHKAVSNELILDVFDIVSFYELKQLFPTLEYGDQIASFVGSRESEGRDVRNSHGFVRFRIPCGDGRTYQVLSFGVYAKSWPNSALKFIGFMGDTVEACWCIPDPNARYSQRLIGEIVRIFKKGDPGIDRLREDYEKTIKDPTLVFQFCGRNCAHEAEKLVTGKEPSLIMIPIDEVITPALFKLLTIPFSLTPACLKPTILKVIVFTLGGSRTKHGKNLFNAQVAQTGSFNYPGLVPELVAAGKQPGIVFGGHNRDFEPVEL